MTLDATFLHEWITHLLDHFDQNITDPTEDA